MTECVCNPEGCQTVARFPSLAQLERLSEEITLGEAFLLILYQKPDREGG